MNWIDKLFNKLGYLKASAVDDMIKDWNDKHMKRVNPLVDYKDKLKNTLRQTTEDLTDTQLELGKVLSDLHNANNRNKELLRKNRRLLNKQKELKEQIKKHTKEIIESVDKNFRLNQTNLDLIGSDLNQKQLINTLVEAVEAYKTNRTELTRKLYLMAVYQAVLENKMDRVMYGFSFSTLESLTPNRVLTYTSLE